MTQGTKPIILHKRLGATSVAVDEIRVQLLGEKLKTRQVGRISMDEKLRNRHHYELISIRSTYHISWSRSILINKGIHLFSCLPIPWHSEQFQGSMQSNIPERDFQLLYPLSQIMLPVVLQSIGDHIKSS